MERYYVWIVVCFALLLCVVIHIIGRNIESNNQANELNETESSVEHIDSGTQNEDLTTNDNTSSADGTKTNAEQFQSPQDPNQGEWDPQSN